MVAIFLSELGDKTFFLAMILAIRKGRLLAMLASVSALWLMTAISVIIGAMLRTFPRYLGDQYLVQVAAGLLMIAFGIQCFRERLPGEGGDDDEESEKDEAASDIESAISRAKRQTFMSDLVRFSVLIFLAEWGDRSMLATVTVAATRSWLGTFIGGCLGHLCACFLAVFTGSLLEKYLSDRFMKISSGTCFVVFGVLTLLGIY